MDTINVDVTKEIKTEMEYDEMCSKEEWNFNKTDLVKNEVVDYNESIENDAGMPIETAFVDVKIEVNSTNDNIDCSTDLHGGTAAFYIKTEMNDNDVNIDKTSDTIKYNCDQCDYESTEKRYLVNHVASVHKGIKYDCAHCNYKATAKFSLVQHTKSVHEGVRFKCKQCEYEAKWKHTLTRHIANVHEGIKYNCEQCEHKAKTKWSLVEHIKTVHEGVRFKCLYCEYEAKWKYALQRHVTYVHEGVVEAPTRWANGVPPARWVWGRFVCDQCEKDCGYSQNLALHRKRTHGLTVRQKSLGSKSQAPILKPKKTERVKLYADAEMLPISRITASPKIIEGGLVKAMPCKECPACLLPDCGDCGHCWDKKKFGGPGKLKRRCKKRTCLNPKPIGSPSTVSSKYIRRLPHFVSSKAGFGTTSIVRKKDVGSERACEELESCSESRASSPIPENKESLREIRASLEDFIEMGLGKEAPV